MNKLNIFFVIFCALIVISSCSNNTGIEGEWKEFSYSYESNDVKVHTKTKILVENSYYRPDDDNKISLFVDWKVINTGTTPSSFGWRNKAVIDNEGRIFTPILAWKDDYFLSSKRKSAFFLQPLEESPPMRVKYLLPSAVNIFELSWGLYHGNPNEGLKYKIKLNPQKSKI